MIIENSIAHEIYHIRIILLKYQKINIIMNRLVLIGDTYFQKIDVSKPRKSY